MVYNQPAKKETLDSVAILFSTLIIEVWLRARGVSVHWWLVTLWRERAVASTPQAIIVLASSDEILPHCARPHCFANTNLLGKILEQIRSRTETSRE